MKSASLALAASSPYQSSASTLACGEYNGATSVDEVGRRCGRQLNGPSLVGIAAPGLGGDHELFLELKIFDRDVLALDAVCAVRVSKQTVFFVESNKTACEVSFSVSTRNFVAHRSAVCGRRGHQFHFSRSNCFLVCPVRA